MKFHKGDIVKVNLNPTKGHEQGNYRPVLVLNEYPIPGDVNLVVPITTKEKTYPLEIPLDDRTTTKGVILCFQVRTLDLNVRNAKYVEKMPDDVVDTCIDYINRLMGKK